ncbi:MAG: DUF3108 domain-containing protein [Cyclobacteriaceae bacterium]|nr:DUF3108 domain-containing protein [Cyclobacteriaceae bacterium]
MTCRRMRKKVIIFSMLAAGVMGLSSFINWYKETYRVIDNNIFFPGEVMEYKVEFSFLDAGVARMVIADKLQKINGRSCYKIDVFGHTTGITDFFMHVKDTWGTFLDSTSIMPHRSYRILEEGKYKKHEIVYYNQLGKKAEVHNYSYKRGYWVEPEEFEIPHYVHDMVSGYYYLRLLDFDSLDEGDIVQLDGFLEDTVYNFKIRYLGKGKLKTDLGEINSLILSPIMPENSLFDGENSIKVWISDDRNKVPLKVKASMFLGAVEVNISSYKQGGRK